MKPSLVLIAILTVGGLNAYAGETGTHGGNTIICFDQQSRQSRKIIKDINKHAGKLDRKYISSIRSARLIEVAEIQNFRDEDNRPAVLLLPDEANPTISGYVDRVIDRFQRYLPFYSELITKGRDILSKMNISRLSEPIPRVNDFTFRLSTDEAKHCTIVTVARQFHNGTSEALEIDQPLLDKIQELSPVSVGVLFLHEYVYQAFRRVGRFQNTNSVGHRADSVRYLVKQMVTYSSNSSLKSFYSVFRESPVSGFTDDVYPPTVNENLRNIVADLIFNILRYVAVANAGAETKPEDLRKFLDDAWPQFAPIALQRMAQLASLSANDPLLSQMNSWLAELHLRIRSTFHSHWSYSSYSSNITYAYVRANTTEVFAQWYVDVEDMFPVIYDGLLMIKVDHKNTTLVPLNFYETMMPKKLNFNGELQ